MNGPDVLFRNRGDGTFQNVTQAVGLESATAGIASNGALWVDVDNDGDQDLYLTVLGSSEAVNQDANRFFLFINNNGVFSEDGRTRGVALDDGATHIGQTATAGDFDLDGLVDIVVTQWTGRKITAHTRIFRNLGSGYFHDVTDESPIFSLTNEFFFAPVLVCAPFLLLLSCFLASFWFSLTSMHDKKRPTLTRTDGPICCSLGTLVRASSIGTTRESLNSPRRVVAQTPRDTE